MLITPEERRKILLDRIRSCSIRRDSFAVGVTGDSTTTTHTFAINTTGITAANNKNSTSQHAHLSSSGGNGSGRSTRTGQTEATPVVTNMNYAAGAAANSYEENGNDGYFYHKFPRRGQQQEEEEKPEEEEEFDAIETSLLSDDTVLVAEGVEASLISSDEDDSDDDDDDGNDDPNISFLSDDVYYQTASSRRAFKSSKADFKEGATKREFTGATVAGAIAGLVLGGPLGAVAVGVSSAYIVNRPSHAGNIIRKGGESLSKLGDKVMETSPTARASVEQGEKAMRQAKELLKKHQVMEKLKALEGKHHIKEIKERAFCGCNVSHCLPNHNTKTTTEGDDASKPSAIFHPNLNEQKVSELPAQNDDSYIIRDFMDNDHDDGELEESFDDPFMPLPAVHDERKVLT